MQNLNRKLDIEKAVLYLLFRSYVQEEDTKRTFEEWLEKNNLFMDIPPLHAIDRLWRKYL